MSLYQSDHLPRSKPGTRSSELAGEVSAAALRGRHVVALTTEPERLLRADSLLAKLLACCGREY